MSKKDRPTMTNDGRPLPVLPPDRDARVWARMVRVMFYTPGFMAILLLKTGEPAGFGISVELLMLASAGAVVAGIFIGTQSDGAGATPASKSGTWSGALVLELMSVVPFLCAIPALFHELASSTLIHTQAESAQAINLGASELLPAMALVPFFVYQLADFGTMHYVLSRPVNWLINILIAVLIVTSYRANRAENYVLERELVGALVVVMAITVVYGVLRLRSLTAQFDAMAPHKEKKDKKDKEEKKEKKRHDEAEAAQ
ncbi:MAG TPA: hypothetical protein VMS45_05955 [Gemmatimonadaceae bacterium]|nr:hypothetical protein [Gemmatimonadaceae bacterium]